jgi:hypothetical protein
MSTTPNPYIPHKPGELITAEDWNAMQGLIKQDIGGQIKQAVGEIKKVDQAVDAGTLQGKNLKQIEEDILTKAFEQLPKRTGYQMIFKRLTKDDEKVIEHKLKACPLVDVYQLDYFEVVCSEDDEKKPEWVNFYLWNSSEKRFKGVNNATQNPIVIESTDPKSHPYKIPFSDMLYRYNVQYTDDSSLEDLVNGFWTAFFSDPNDRFDEDQYCHSPWFDRCCREKNSVGEIKKKGEWDDLWFQMRPIKTINYPLTAAGQPNPTPGTPPNALPSNFQFPHNIQISHFDFDTLGIRLIADPVYSSTWFPNDDSKINTREEKVMLLLKV